MATPNYMPMRGNCPACGKRSLRLEWAPGASSGEVHCGTQGCSEPLAVQKLLAEDHICEHIAALGHETWTVRHPLIERLDGSLFNCNLGAVLRDEFGPPRQGVGMYKLRLVDTGAGRPDLVYERIGDLPPGFDGWDDDLEED